MKWIDAAFIVTAILAILAVPVGASILIVTTLIGGFHPKWLGYSIGGILIFGTLTAIVKFSADSTKALAGDAIELKRTDAAKKG